MAYNISWDESQPDGSENANTIDTEIQELKESIRERMEDLFPDWSDDGVDPKVFARVRVSLTSTESISDSTITPVPWDQADFETVSTMWDVANPTRLVAPTTAFYMAFGGLDYAGNVTGDRSVYITKNGASLPETAITIPGASGSIISIAWAGVLAANDYLELEAEQDSGGPLNVVVNNATYFILVRLA